MKTILRSDWCDFLRSKQNELGDGHFKCLFDYAFVGGENFINSYYARPMSLSFQSYENLLDSFCDAYGYLREKVPSSDRTTEIFGLNEDVTYTLFPITKIIWKYSF